MVINMVKKTVIIINAFDLLIMNNENMDNNWWEFPTQQNYQTKPKWETQCRDVIKNELHEAKQCTSYQINFTFYQEHFCCFI